MKSTQDPNLEFKNKMRAAKGLAPLEPDGPPPVAVFDDLRWALDGFWRLSNARPVSMNGPLRIPLTEVEAYCRLRAFSFEKSQDFLHYLERLDERYMQLVKESQEKEEAKRNTSGTQPRPNTSGRKR